MPQLGGAALLIDCSVLLFSTALLLFSCSLLSCPISVFISPRFFALSSLHLCIHPVLLFLQLQLSPLASHTLSDINNPSDGHFVQSHMHFVIAAIPLRSHTTGEPLSLHVMSRVYRLHEHQEGKRPVVVVFNSLWAVRYIHMAPSQHCAPWSPLDRDNADRNQLDPLMKGTPEWTLLQTEIGATEQT